MNPTSERIWLKNHPLLGELISCTTSLGRENINGVDIPFKVQSCRYDYGHYTVRLMDVCFDRRYEFTRASFNEVYHTMMREPSYGPPQALEKPKPPSENGGTTVFEGTALTSQIKIRVNGDGAHATTTAAHLRS